MIAPVRAALVVAAIAVAAPLSAQVSPVLGEVVDRASGHPVADVNVTLYRGDSAIAATRTDAAGRFAVPAVPHGKFVLRARRVGFAHAELNVAVGTAVQPVQIQLDAEAAASDSLDLEGDLDSGNKLGSFRLRRDAKRQGIFMERDEFPKNAQYVSDVFRQVPGAELRGANIGSRVRLRNCRPALWVDGVKTDHAEMDEVVSLPDVAAMEIYPSLMQAPPQYQDRDTRCGSVLIWLR